MPLTADQESSICFTLPNCLLHIEGNECLGTAVTRGLITLDSHRCLSAQQSEDLRVTRTQGLLSQGQCIDVSWEQEVLPSSLPSQLPSAVSPLSLVGAASQQSHSKLRACRCGHRIADERSIWSRHGPLCAYGAMLTSHTSDSPSFLGSPFFLSSY